MKEVCESFKMRVDTYIADKREKIKKGKFSKMEYFICWYRLKYIGKNYWLSSFIKDIWRE